MIESTGVVVCLGLFTGVGCSVTFGRVSFSISVILHAIYVVTSDPF